MEKQHESMLSSQFSKFSISEVRRRSYLFEVSIDGSVIVVVLRSVLRALRTCLRSLGTLLLLSLLLCLLVDLLAELH